MHYYNWIFSTSLQFIWHCMRILCLISISKYIFLVVISVYWSPMINRTPKYFTFANFGQPVSKSWLRPLIPIVILQSFKKYKNCKDLKKILHTAPPNIFAITGLRNIQAYVLPNPLINLSNAAEATVQSIGFLKTISTMSYCYSLDSAHWVLSIFLIFFIIS